MHSPITVSAEALVQDINNQTQSSSTSFVVHPSSYYIGIRALQSVAIQVPM